MAFPSSQFPHAQLERARQYKVEFLMKIYGVAAAAAGGDISTDVSVFDFASNHDNIIGLGYGLKVTNGTVDTTAEAVRVYVHEKVPVSSLPQSRIVPSNVNGLPTDVVPIGNLVAAVRRATACGVSVGHYAITAGTLGCLVKKPDEDSYFILSNNHVLADCDRAHIGDLILEPGPSDGGSLDDPIAHLADFEPITQGDTHVIDAAIARLLEPGSVMNDILVIGRVQQPSMQAELNRTVLKHGRTTKYTRGTIVGIDEDVPVIYDNRIINFEEQLAIKGDGGPFADLGDSGSLVVDADTKCPVGLFFAVDLGGDGTAFANSIMSVLERFRIEVL